MNLIKELKKENNKESRKIMLDDLGLIRNITDNMNEYLMNSYDKQIVKRDLIGMAQEMKLRGTTLRDELGDNVDEFTKEIIENSRGPSKLEIFLTTIKSSALTFIIIFGGMLLLSKNFDMSMSIYFPILVYLFLGIQGILEFIFVSAFNMEKNFKKYIPNVIRGLTFFIFFYYFIGNKITRGGPEVKIVCLVIIHLFIYAITYFTYNKHIENLAKNSDNILRDLVDKQ
ncbi:MAG: hypothetical protein SCJ93_12105 [Bacillota bacterium]|nr:hypothetical protein [Bacillota bacterium]